MSLAGINTVSGNIVLRGPVGIGVEQVFTTTPGDNYSANAPSQLTLTGQQSEGPVLTLSANASGNTAENDNVIQVGSTSGTLVLNADVLTQPGDVRIYDGNTTTNPTQAVLLYDSTTNGTAHPDQPGPGHHHGDLHGHLRHCRRGTHRHWLEHRRDRRAVRPGRDPPRSRSSSTRAGARAAAAPSGTTPRR